MLSPSNLHLLSNFVQVYLIINVLQIGRMKRRHVLIAQIPACKESGMKQQKDFILHSWANGKQTITKVGFVKKKILSITIVALATAGTGGISWKVKISQGKKNEYFIKTNFQTQSYPIFNYQINLTNFYYHRLYS